jgi:CBS domain-containing protein
VSIDLFDTGRPVASASELYGPFAAGVDALRPLSCDAVARPARRIEVAAPDEPLREAASRMGWRKVGALAVVEGERLVGSLSEDDLLRVTALRLGERADVVEREGGSLVVWEALLEKLTVADAMTPREQLPVVAPGTPLVPGIQQICAPTGYGTRFRYLWIVDERERVSRVLSIRDVARSLTRIYDGELPAEAFGGEDELAAARAAVGVVLDLSIQTIRERLSVGHAPSVVRADANGAQTLARMWSDRRGYVLTTLRDGAPLGICTRRDLLRGLRDPCVVLDDLRVSCLMTAPVKTVSDLNTLCALFKLMAIEGCRHMPLVDGSDRVVRMVSMWEGVSLFAPRRGAGG